MTDTLGFVKIYLFSSKDSVYSVSHSVKVKAQVADWEKIPSAGKNAER